MKNIIISNFNYIKTIPKIFFFYLYNNKITINYLKIIYCLVELNFKRKARNNAED